MNFYGTILRISNRLCDFFAFKLARRAAAPLALLAAALARVAARVSPPRSVHCLRAAPGARRQGHLRATAAAAMTHAATLLGAICSTFMAVLATNSALSLSFLLGVYLGGDWLLVPEVSLVANYTENLTMSHTLSLP